VLRSHIIILFRGSGKKICCDSSTLTQAEHCVEIETSQKNFLEFKLFLLRIENFVISWFDPASDSKRHFYALILRPKL
jgi:hypothetical protein